MIGRVNVGGGVVTAAWAYIAVTYPAGSTCTATNGTTTLTAQGTSGLYVFQIPEPTITPETWTVSCTDGTRTRSKTVEISLQYQSTVVILTYSRLPEGYQEVEYLESNGTQYINLGGCNPLSSHKHELTFMNLAATGNVLGNIATSAVRVYIGASNANKIYYYYLGTMAGGAKNTGDKISVVVNTKSGEIIEDGTVLTTIASATGGTNLALFGAFSNSGLVDYGTCRVYEYKQTNLETNQLVYNLVPCYRMSDNVSGMYDLANNTFITNDGTGNFVVGADV